MSNGLFNSSFANTGLFNNIFIHQISCWTLPITEEGISVFDVTSTFDLSCRQRRWRHQNQRRRPSCLLTQVSKCRQFLVDFKKKNLKFLQCSVDFKKETWNFFNVWSIYLRQNLKFLKFLVKFKTKLDISSNFRSSLRQNLRFLQNFGQV